MRTARQRKHQTPKLAPHHLENAKRSLDALVFQTVFRRSPVNRAVTSALLFMRGGRS